MTPPLDTFHDGTLLHLDSLYRIALCMLNDSPAAESCVQEAYAEVHRVVPHGTAGQSLRRMLFTALFRQIPGRRKKKWYRPATASINNVGDCHILDALHSLPEAQRAAILLCDVEDFSEEEAARILDRPRAGLTRHLAEGRELLSNRAHTATSDERQFEGALA